MIAVPFTTSGGHLVEGRAGSLGELLAEVRRLSVALASEASDPQELWYRGQLRSSLSLSPSLYHPNNLRFSYDEPTLFEEFKAHAASLVTHHPADDWEWYFLARHHGLPSRLLDWSEGLLTALYFALRPHIPRDKLAFVDGLRAQSRDACFDGESPAIWILDAGSLNKVSIGEDIIVIPGGEKALPYLPDTNVTPPADDLPLAIYPPRANARIVAQQGVFTIHGLNRAPLDSLAEAHVQIKLGRVLLDRSRAFHMWEELEVLGVTQVSMFPDLDSVAQHICWRHQQ